MTTDIEIKKDSPRRRDDSRDRSSRRSNRRDDRSGRDRDRDRSPINSRQSARRIFVSNIPYDYTWQKLKDLFREKVGEVTFVELFNDEQGRPKGSGIIEFREENLVKKAMDTMQRFEIGDRKIVVKDDFGIERDRVGNIIGGSRYGSSASQKELPSLLNAKSALNPDDIDYGNTYGLSRRFLANLHITSPLVNRVFVANLDYKVDKDKLRDVFRLAGKVTSVEVYVDADGRSRGIGLVEYEHPVEAVQAISMLNDQQLYERFITVRMDRANDNTFNRLPEGLRGIGPGLGNNGEPLKNVALNLAMSAMQTNTANGSTGATINNAPDPAPQLAASNSAAAVTSLLQTLAPLQSLTNVLSGAANANSLMNSDLGLSNPILNTLTQNPTLAALAAANPLLNAASKLGSMNVSGGSDSGSQFQRRDYSSNTLAYEKEKKYHSNSRYNDGSQQKITPEPLMNSRVPTQITDTLFLSNLPVGANWHILRDKFSKFSVKYVDIKQDGTGIVRFSSDWEAERALKAIDQSYVEGRRIDARYY